jgi:beta-lactamase superfamily II metal-dependent hydrolase
MSEIDYVKKQTATVYRNETGNDDRGTLLWGDPVRVLERGAVRSRFRARLRAVDRWIDSADLGGAPLLELYFIDVGQGDGVLIVTPDRKHVLIDGGWTRKYQPTGKNAADFVDWKFYEDYGLDEIHLDCMIASHCDADHYGGLWDLLDRTGDRAAELDTETTRVDAFYHSGVCWWRDNGGNSRWLGPSQGGQLTRLLGDQSHLASVLTGQAGFRPQGEWGQFLAVVSARVPLVQRLSDRSNQSGCVPGFRPQDGEVAIRVFGPIEGTSGDLPTVPDFGSPSLSTNGNSLVLRLDYGKCRILLTGDLNQDSHEALLDRWGANTTRFRCDVGKACHHGSDKVSYRFLRAMNATATIISSGDNESHSHPRPSALAASAVSGYKTLSADGHSLKTPLLYCTEIARSEALGKVSKLTMSEHAQWDFGGQELVIDRDSGAARLHYKGTKSGPQSSFSGRRNLVGSRVLHETIYGLVNVRTDGNTILLAVRDEKRGGWEIETVPARF